MLSMRLIGMRHEDLPADRLRLKHPAFHAVALGHHQGVLQRNRGLARRRALIHERLNSMPGGPAACDPIWREMAVLRPLGLP